MAGMSFNGENVNFRSAKSASLPVEENKLRCFTSQKATIFTPPFQPVRPQSIYKWTRQQSNKTILSSCSSEGYVTKPNLTALNQNEQTPGSRTIRGLNSAFSSINLCTSTNKFSNPSNDSMAKPVFRSSSASPKFDNHSVNRSHVSNYDTNSNYSKPQSPCASVSSHNAGLDNLYTLMEEKTDLISGSEVCSCQRSPQLILCRSCGNLQTGRIRKRCLVHPNQLYLMDQLCCSECESRNLKEIASAHSPTGE